MLQQLRRLIAVSSLHLLMRRCHSNPGYLQVDGRVHPWITKQHRWGAALQLAAAAAAAVSASASAAGTETQGDAIVSK